MTYQRHGAQSALSLPTYLYGEISPSPARASCALDRGCRITISEEGGRPQPGFRRGTVPQRSPSHFFR